MDDWVKTKWYSSWILKNSFWRNQWQKWRILLTLQPFLLFIRHLILFTIAFHLTSRPPTSFACLLINNCDCHSMPSRNYTRSKYRRIKLRLYEHYTNKFVFCYQKLAAFVCILLLMFTMEWERKRETKSETFDKLFVARNSPVGSMKQ